ncbi:NADH-quinone oxidoreductase subunit N [Acrocarpospora phusangensis]|uniref:NADH-quinone oxidoreductase subunit N n=1 Tax=Acrocarpospora phusangensis TaxID=1070424 RepID=A0A919Q9J5_9ACTN|nr:NADH-quinone oxidoreductase subunit N [Acrocarpospora phusangensis]GIH22332.1 NADH-quinone oxidoreductase subunit N [Acrocarpospora phusangensis]
MIQSIDYWAIAAPLILALTAGLVLVLDAFLPARVAAARTALGVITLAGVLAALGVVVAQAVRGEELRTFCVPGDASSCSFVFDWFTGIFAGLTLAAGVIVVLLSLAELAGGRIPVGEWYFLLLATLTGAVLLPAARDLVMLVVALELVSLPVFALTALRRYDGRASEASLKLFVVSVVSTAVMLFGVSLLYGATGSMHLNRVAAALQPTLAASSTASGSALSGAHQELTGAVFHNGAAVVTVAVVLVVAGFAFKVAAVPFHFWAGDVYEGAPVPVAALLSVISKAAGFAGLLLVLTQALFSEAATWTPLVAIIAALTMTVGNVLALRQRHAVRMLAWSSVAQSGYILAPLAVHMDIVAFLNAMHTQDATGLNQSGNTFASDSGAFVVSKSQDIELPATVGMPGAVNASIAYLVLYAAMNLLAFAVVMLIARRHKSNQLDDYRGLAFRSPGAALSLAFALICLAGLPPGLAGLFAKVVVFREIVSGGLGWLAVVMAINTVIGLYYYLAWTARLFVPAPAGSASAGESRTGGEDRGRTPVILAIGAALLITVAFSVAPQLVLTAIG